MCEPRLKGRRQSGRAGVRYDRSWDMAAGPRHSDVFQSSLRSGSLEGWRGAFIDLSQASQAVYTFILLSGKTTVHHVCARLQLPGSSSRTASAPGIGIRPGLGLRDIRVLMHAGTRGKLSPDHPSSQHRTHCRRHLKCLLFDGICMLSRIPYGGSCQKICLHSMPSNL